MTYEKKLDAIVITWLEVNETKPTFQKRIYKDVDRAKEYLQRMFETKKDRISNVQVKICYQLS